MGLSDTVCPFVCRALGNRALGNGMEQSTKFVPLILPQNMTWPESMPFFHLDALGIASTHKCTERPYMAVVLNSFICKRPFFANEKFTFANLSRTPRLSFAGVSCENISLNLSQLDDGWPESVEEQGLLLLVWRHLLQNNILKMCYRQTRRGVSRQSSTSTRQ